MATTDDNGLVQFTVDDPVEPLQANLNAISSSVSSALNAIVRPFIVDNLTQRNNLASQRPPTNKKPLLVWRTDQKKFELNSGSGWGEWPPPFEWEPEDPELPGPNEVWIGDQKYQRTGVTTSYPKSPAFRRFGNVYARTFTFTGPYTPPEGWYFSLKCGQTTGFTFVENAYTSSKKTFTARHIQIGNSTVSALKSIIWELKKR